MSSDADEEGTCPVVRNVEMARQPPSNDPLASCRILPPARRLGATAGYRDVDHRPRTICKDGTMSAHYDVVIVGGGIAGLSLASALAGRCSVALIEAEQTLAYHTSARSARQLIPSYGPPVVQGVTVRTLDLIAAQDAERREPVLTPRSFML